MGSTIGQRIKHLREQRGISQSQLVAGLPLTASYISLIESGRRQPRDRVLEHIAERLGCTVEYLVTGRRGPGAQELELELRFAELALRSGDAPTARDRFEQIVRHATAMRCDDVAQDARWGLYRAEEALGNLEAAIEGLENLAREPVLKGTFSRTAVATRLARNHLECGEVTRAIEVAEAGLAADPDPTMDRDELTELASTLVACYYERGDLTRAHVLARRVIAEAERTSSARARAAAYWNAGIVAEGRGDLRSARAYTERALALYSEGDNGRATAILRLNCAWLLLRSPDPDPAEAAALLHRALADLTQVGSPADIARVETELARCHLLDGRAEEAVRVAGAAVERLSPGPRLEAARARSMLAKAQLASGDLEGAIATSIAASAELAEAGASRQAAAVWRELGDGLLTLGLVNEAVSAYQSTADAAGVPKHPDPAIRMVAGSGRP